MIIVYQSLNSGNQDVNTEKAESSAVNSHFTRTTHTSLAEEFNMIDTDSLLSSSPSLSHSGTYFSAQPVNPGSVGSKRKRSQFRTPLQAGIPNNLALLEKVIHQIETEVAFSYKNKPGIIVLGEVYLKKNTLLVLPYKVLHSTNNKKACQSFTVLIHRNLNASLITVEESQSPIKYPILTYNGIRIGFVHIPNEIANDSSATVDFFDPNAAHVDIVMGDTNFHSQAKLQQVGATVWGWRKDTATKWEKESLPLSFPAQIASSATLHPGPQGKGTNSTENYLYDQGMSKIPGSHFSQSTVNWSENILGPQPAFQFLGVLGKCFIENNGEAVPFSDHNGLVISVVDPINTRDMDDEKTDDDTSSDTSPNTSPKRSHKMSGNSNSPV